jgi:hypothetical protein
MWQYLQHLWSPPPANVPLACPPPAPGEAPDLNGFFDPGPVAAAYSWIFWASLAAVLLSILLCYLAYSSSLSRGFVRRWYGFLIGTMLACALIPVLVMYLTPQYALAGSCETNPLPFAADLPGSLMFMRATAGFVWALFAFVLFSWIFTFVAGRHPASGGFFHNRGCPWPRRNPIGA